MQHKEITENLGEFQKFLEDVTKIGVVRLQQTLLCIKMGKLGGETYSFFKEDLPLSSLSSFQALLIFLIRIEVSR